MIPSVFTTADAPSGLLSKIRALLDDAFEGDFCEDDWQHTLGGWHVVAIEDDVPLAHAAVVPRVLEIGGRRFRSGYVEGVATMPARRGQGLGTLVMAGLVPVLHAEFDVGVLSTGLPRFFQRLGWERWRGPSFVWRDGELIRTEEEDDGLMALRFGPSLDLDLAASITCEARRGDDW